MKSIIFWIIAVILAGFAAAFAAFNQHHAVLDLWPLDVHPSVPLFLIVLVALAIGFLLGGVVVYFLGGPNRALRREALYRNEMLERENSSLRHKNDAPRPGKEGSALPSPR